jgi:peptidyl-prolyl cis-trans isomerase A (cyclophilin A)
MRRAILPVLLLSIPACAGGNDVAQAPMAPAPVSSSAESTPDGGGGGALPVVGGTRSGESSDRPASTAKRGDDQQDAIAQVMRGPDQPRGRFSMADATAGLPGSGPLVATIKTSVGDLRCSLDERHAPTTVANFVGLARGVRPWKNPDSGVWENRPAYDGTTFHRIIKGFMIQGGDPTGTGTGEPGYTIPDEPWAGAAHDRAGLLCMANRGPDTNGMQFFITDAATPHLDRGRTAYTIFGECSPVSVVHAIANVPVGVADRPTTPVRIVSVTISR